MVSHFGSAAWRMLILAMVLSLISNSIIPSVHAKKLLKLAAATAVIRGGPIIPILIRYPVRTAKEKTAHDPIAHHYHHELHEIW